MILLRSGAARLGNDAVGSAAQFGLAAARFGSVAAHFVSAVAQFGAAVTSPA